MRKKIPIAFRSAGQSKHGVVNRKIGKKTPGPGFQAWATAELTARRLAEREAQKPVRFDDDDFVVNRTDSSRWDHEFIRAVHNGSVERVKQILEKGANLYARLGLDVGHTALHTAASIDDDASALRKLDFLLQPKLFDADDLNLLAGSKKETVWDYALKRPTVDVLDKLLEEDGDKQFDSLLRDLIVKHQTSPQPKILARLLEAGGLTDELAQDQDFIKALLGKNDPKLLDTLVTSKHMMEELLLDFKEGEATSIDYAVHTDNLETAKWLAEHKEPGSFADSLIKKEPSAHIVDLLKNPELAQAVYPNWLSEISPDVLYTTLYQSLSSGRKQITEEEQIKILSRVFSEKFQEPEVAAYSEIHNMDNPSHPTCMLAQACEQDRGDLALALAEKIGDQNINNTFEGDQESLLSIAANMDSLKTFYKIATSINQDKIIHRLKLSKSPSENPRLMSDKGKLDRTLAVRLQELEASDAEYSYKRFMSHLSNPELTKA